MFSAPNYNDSGIASGTHVFNGFVWEFNGNSSASPQGNTIMESCGYVNATTMSGITTIFNLVYNGATSWHNFGGIGTYIVDNWLAIHSWFLKPSSATIIFKSKVVGGANFSSSGVTISSGKVVFEQGFQFDDADANQLGVLGTPAIYLTGGILEIIAGTCENKASGGGYVTHGASMSACIIHRGGTLILRNPTLKTNRIDTPIIIADTAPQNIYIQGQLFSNRVENGGTLSAKKQKNLVYCTASSNTLTLNDGTGGSVGYTANTGTAIGNATSITSQINLDIGMDVSATDNGDGTITLESDVAGNPYTLVSTAGGITITYLRLNSYAISNILGGNIIENANVQ